MQGPLFSFLEKVLKMPLNLTAASVGDLFIFSGIGVTILLSATVNYLAKRELFKKHWYGKMIGSLIFTTPFYLLSTLFILLYIIFNHDYLLKLGFWAITIGTLLLIFFQAYFTLCAAGETFLNYIYIQMLKRDNQANSS